jgi:hypothetical protein
MISFLALALFALPQDPIDETSRLKPLVPAPAQTAAPAKPVKPTPPQRPQQGPSFGGAKRSGSLTAGPPMVQDTGTGPRKADPNLVPPFSHNRTLLRVNGVDIRASEINELVLYYRSYRSGRSDMQLAEAVNALLPLKVMSAHFKSDIPGMIDGIDAAYAAIVGGEDFKAVVARVSNDSEAENEEASYTFGRGRAVQPFDRFSFTLPLNTLSPPFLTVYGFHLVEVLNYKRGENAADDESTMRHVLVMYPGMVKLEEDGEDVRKWIKAQVKLAKIEVVEAGMENLVPPQYRDQIVKD